MVFKCYLLLVFFTIFQFDYGQGRDVIITEDKPYEVMKISIPRNIWNQAINPTPVLKSTVTITLPVNVQEEEYTDEVIEQDIESTTVVLNDTQVEQDITTDATSVNATQTPVLEDEVTTTESSEVTGEVQRFPCSCDGQCGCCTGAILQRFNMKACASDPPPVCFNPGRAPFVRVCAEISNIRIRNRNAFACLDINADIGGFEIYSASFRCFGLGSKGVQTGLKPKKPVSGGPKPVSLFGSSNNNNRNTFLQNVLLGGGGNGGGLFGGESGAPGPLGALGNAVGGLFE